MDTDRIALEQEILDLVAYHRKALKKGLRHQPDGEAMAAELERIEGTVLVLRNNREAEEEADRKELLLKEYCPACKVQRDMRVDRSGELDRTICTVCGTVVQELPHGIKGKLAELDRLMTGLTTVGADGTTPAERAPQQKQLAKILREADAMRKKIRQDAREQEQRDRKVDDALRTMRDVLLKWKFRTQHPGPWSGEAQA